MADVKRFIEKQTNELIQVIPFSFPEMANDDCIRFEINQGGADRGDVGEIVLSIDVRSKDPNKSETIAINLNNKLHNLTNETLGGKQVIAVKRRQVYPQYLGQDKNSRHYYSADYLFLLSD